MESRTTSTISPDELPNRAFQLAYFLHCERKTATEIASRALNKLQLAATAQGKRLYYRLTGRTDARKSRSKVSMGEPHLLQRLVYVESEEYERQRELAVRDPHHNRGTTPARQTDLVVFFIKHLVRITTKRNSFYVTLGMSRLLYNYTTPETMELYNLVIQDPDRVHDDYYYRSRKGVLLKELKERFGDLLEITKGARGEQRWQTLQDGNGYHGLVRECLQWFTPWSTPCVVPERFDPFTDTIEKLDFHGGHPDQEHEVEVNRIHAALHPECFARLVAASKLEAPDERLELPHFQVDDDDTHNSPRTPPPISESDLRVINELLAQEAARRKAASAGFFRVLVDGEERAGIDPHESRTTQFMVDDTAEVVEVYGSDERGPLLLATHLLNFAGPQSQTTAITLERGQRFSFTTDFPVDDPEGVKSAQVTVNYEERAPGVFASTSGALSALVNSVRGLALAPSSWWKPAAALAALGLMVVSIWFAWSRLAGTTPPEIVTKSSVPTPLSSPLPSPVTPGPVNGPAPDQRKRPQINQKETPGPQLVKNPPAAGHERDETFVARTIVPDTSAATPEVEPSRGWDRAVMGKPLSEVRRVFVQAINENDQGRNLRTQLRERLTTGSGLQSAESEQADAALKIIVRPASTRSDEKRVIAIVRVVNANGYVVWPASRRGANWRYVGAPSYVADRIVADLSRDIGRAGTHKSNQRRSHRDDFAPLAAGICNPNRLLANYTSRVYLHHYQCGSPCSVNAAQ